METTANDTVVDELREKIRRYEQQCVIIPLESLVEVNARIGNYSTATLAERLHVAVKQIDCLTQQVAQLKLDVAATTSGLETLRDLCRQFQTKTNSKLLELSERRKT